MRGLVEIGQQTAVDLYRHVNGFARSDSHALPADQARATLAHRVGQVKLRHVIAGPAAAIMNIKAGRQRIAAFDPQIGIVEPGVGQTETEGEKRLQFLRDLCAGGCRRRSE
jgi:hypothetical protein